MKQYMSICLCRFPVWMAFMLLLAGILSGCSSKYEAVEIETLGISRAGSAAGEASQFGKEPELTLDPQGAGLAFAAAEPESAAASEGEEADAALEEGENSAGNGAEIQNRSMETALAESAAENGDSLTYQDGLDREETETEVPSNGHTVAIDAGHQAKANAEKEPIGPSSSTMKAKMPEGGVGTVSGVEEYELTLTVAEKLQTELETKGYQVVMIRTGHDVNLSHAERSAIANQSGAEILIRLHASSMDNSGIYGALAMCMTSQNPYNAQLHDQSYRLSKLIVDQICGLTGTKNRGVQETDNNGEINWSEIPVSVVKMGFLTNPDEDLWLQDGSYQDKIVTGIVNAVDTYFAADSSS